MTQPTLCWCWNEGARTTAPSIRLIREIIDGAGIEVNGYHWARVQRITEGHPEPAIEHALMQVYTEQCIPVWNDVAPSTEQPRPSALSRIWANSEGERMNEDFAVFEYVGDGYEQLSLWMTKDRAEAFAKEGFIGRDKIIFQRFPVSEGAK